MEPGHKWPKMKTGINSVRTVRCVNNNVQQVGRYKYNVSVAAAVAGPGAPAVSHRLS